MAWPGQGASVRESIGFPGGNHYHPLAARARVDCRKAGDYRRSHRLSPGIDRTSGKVPDRSGRRCGYLPTTRLLDCTLTNVHSCVLPPVLWVIPAARMSSKRRHRTVYGRESVPASWVIIHFIKNIGNKRLKIPWVFRILLRSMATAPKEGQSRIGRRCHRASIEEHLSWRELSW